MQTNRRHFIATALGSAAGAWSCVGLVPRPTLGGNAVAVGPERKPADWSLTEIAGKPRERGRTYGAKFKDGIHAFLEREIYRAFEKRPATKDEMLNYAGACSRFVGKYSPEIHDELEGMAEGSGLKLEEIVLITLHEELYHRGVLPKVDHCTAVAIGPPETVGGGTSVGQTWDWMESVAGMSTMLRWKRSSGPSVLAYAFPGLWVGAGLNSSGIALVWTSADLGDKKLGARVGIPSYVLLAHLLYQPTLDAVIEEAKRATNAGWFTFVLGDSAGNLLNVEGSPKEIVVEKHRGRLVRVGFGSRGMTKRAGDVSLSDQPRCKIVGAQVDSAKGKVDRGWLQTKFADRKLGVCVGPATIDMLVFDTSLKEAHVSRGPDYGVNWTKFGFQS